MIPQQPVVFVGLGNPGQRYADTRHNVGTMVVDKFAREVGGSFASRKKLHCEILTTNHQGISIVVGKPLTYMNESGRAVAQISKFYSASPHHLVVVHDELDLPPGVIRIKKGGGDGGHNGLRSITSHLGSSDYFRIRVGIGRPPEHHDPADYVLKNFSQADTELVDDMTTRCLNAFNLLITQGLTQTQNTVHISNR